MKNVIALATLVCLSAGSAFAGDQVADQTLAKMGLGNMKSMSDEQGMQVRGMAFVKVSGWSAAANHNAETYNDYVAIGHSAAIGGSTSKVYSTKQFGHFKVTKTAGASGGAFAAAH